MTDQLKISLVTWPSEKNLLFIMRKKQNHLWNIPHKIIKFSSLGVNLAKLDPKYVFEKFWKFFVIFY